jgi:hypothetical protein
LIIQTEPSKALLAETGHADAEESPADAIAEPTAEPVSAKPAAGKLDSQAKEELASFLKQLLSSNGVIDASFSGDVIDLLQAASEALVS